MSFIHKMRTIWKDDPLLRSVVKNSSYLFSSNTISMGLSFLQGLLAAALLGAGGYGTLGLVTSFASNVNRLLSFRMNELVIKYAGQYLAEGRKIESAAVIKIAALSEALTSIVAYGLLLLLAGWGAEVFIKDVTVTPWIMFYGLALLANMTSETATAVLQISGHFRTQAGINLGQNILTASWILAAFLVGGDIYAVILAYLAGKLFFGLGMSIAAIYWLRPLLGSGWWRVELRQLRRWKEMLRFAISTNLSQTVNMVIRDSEILWVGLLLTNVQAGYYKFALAIMSYIGLPISPLIHTTFPEISRAVVQRTWVPLQNLLRRTSSLAAAWTLGVGAIILLVGKWFLGVFRGGEFAPSFWILVVLFIGYGFANIFFWNRPLLLAFGMPNYPLLVTFAAGIVKTGLMFLLVRQFGVMMQAGLLSLYFLFSIGILLLRGLAEIRAQKFRDALVENPA